MPDLVAALEVLPASPLLEVRAAAVRAAAVRALLARQAQEAFRWAAWAVPLVPAPAARPAPAAAQTGIP